MTTPSPTTGRVVLVALATALLATVAVPFALGDLPERLATNWDLQGRPTSAASPTGLAAVALAFVVPTAIGLVAVAWFPRPTTPQRRPMLAGVLAVVGAAVALAVPLSVLGSRDVVDWRDAAGPTWWQVAAHLAVTLAAGAVAAWAAAGLPSVREPLVAAAPLDVPDTEEVAWSNGLTVRWAVVAGTLLAASGLVVLVVGPILVGLSVIAAAVPALLLARIDVHADRRGLVVTYGPAAWPRTRIPVERIESVAAIDVRPMDWGGWGYRGSVRLFRQAAVVLRAGPGVRVDLRDGRRFVVTVDDAATAAAVLSREVRLHRGDVA